MNFLRSRAEQLADYLRGCIARGELREPLPNIRAWSAKLGVGLHTLETALRILHREGVVRILPRKGVQLLGASGDSEQPPRARVVRWICYRRDFPDLSPVMDVLTPMADQLRDHDIGFSIEPCDATRLRLIHDRGESPHEMYLLTSLPQPFERMFADFKKSALIIGLPSAGISLPYLSVDVFPAVRHAVHMLARRGFRKVTLVVKSGTSQPIAESLHRYCAETHPPMQAEVVIMPMELTDQVAAAGRFAARIRERVGIIAIYSIPASVLMTALMARGVKVPDDVEIVAVNTTLQAVRVFPLPAYYPFPLATFAKAVCKAALHYFERGRLPALRKTIPLEMVSPSA